MKNRIYFLDNLRTFLILLVVVLHSELVYSFKKKLNKTTPLFSELNRNPYLVYIIHIIMMGIIALAIMNIQLSGMLKFLILSIVTFVISNMMITSWRMATQKQFNTMKTIVRSLVIIFIMGAAFHGYPETLVPKQVQTQQQCTNSIHAAIIADNMESVKKMITTGADLDQKEPASGSSPLMTAALFNRIEIAKALIDAGTSINLINKDGSTALHTASFFCRTEIVKLLLDTGADKTIRNNANATALESVQAPFEAMKPIYDYIQSIYEPLGLKFDLQRIHKTRPEIEKLLAN